VLRDVENLRYASCTVRGGVNEILCCACTQI
jgi:hypothetical protein